MTAKKPPPKPTNLRFYECDLIINSQYLAKLSLSISRSIIGIGEKGNPTLELAKQLITND